MLVCFGSVNVPMHWWVSSSVLSCLVFGCVSCTLTKDTQVGECVYWKDLAELILVLMIKLHKFSMYGIEITNAKIGVESEELKSPFYF